MTTNVKDDAAWLQVLGVVQVGIQVLSEVQVHATVLKVVGVSVTILWMVLTLLETHEHGQHFGSVLIQWLQP